MSTPNTAGSYGSSSTWPTCPTHGIAMSRIEFKDGSNTFVCPMCQYSFAVKPPAAVMIGRVFMTIEWSSAGHPDQDASLRDEIVDLAMPWLEGYDPKFLGPVTTETLEQAFHWSEAERARVENENERLRGVLTEARAEVDRWGHGDFHYGNTPRDKGVLAMLAKIDAALDEPRAEG